VAHGYDVELDPDGVEPDPAGGAPGWPEPLPMLGQFWVEPELELEPEPELEPELLLPDEVLEEPELELLEDEDGVVVVDVEPVPELPEDVVAALATNAPPVSSPVVSAPMASTLRRRSFMDVLPFNSRTSPARSDRHRTRCAPKLWLRAMRGRRVRTVP
jgi:hypothetical protein